MTSSHTTAFRPNAIHPRAARRANGSAPRAGGRRSTPGASTTRAAVLALAAALLVLAGGGAYALGRAPAYEARLDVLVTPSTTASVSDSAALFDSLSRGQVAATAAEVYRQQQWRGGRSGTVEAGVITPSAVVQVTARASSAAAARDLVAAVVAAAGPTLNRELAPYQVSRLDPDAPSAASVGLSRVVMLGLVLLAAILAGAAVLRLAAPRRRVATA